MNWVKGFALVIGLAVPLSALIGSGAWADPAAGTPIAAKKAIPTKAMLTQCSSEADAKGLFVRSGKGEARKDYRRHCVRKLLGLE